MLKEYFLIQDKDNLLKLEERYGSEIEPEDSSGLDCLYLLEKYYHLSDRESEFAYLIAMDYYKFPKVIYQISMGDYKGCYMYNRTIGAVLLLAGARRFMVVHNHPDRENAASGGDIANRQVLQELADFLEIVFDGSYIVTKCGWHEVLDDNINEW